MVLEKKLIRMTILAENKNKKILSSVLIDCGSITGSQWIALAQVYSTMVDHSAGRLEANYIV